ncbi:MAG: hypothetical protein C4B59_04755 [Candidatus Methanogaster sp.]|uniref:Uncharacterized protein n=1 Tax=Candidatus Methanogaster sp. TaxID=3386292 RepID=A0AC61L4M8_9EURY|nr:MAG: hypothetical protein C4B59_04755 [ANME-2 cluster archaeon]
MSITIEVPESIDSILDRCSREEHLDKVSALNRILWTGAESYLVNQYSSGRISKGKLAELLDLDIYEVNELLEKHHVKDSKSYERFTRGIEVTERSK